MRWLVPFVLLLAGCTRPDPVERAFADYHQAAAALAGVESELAEAPLPKPLPRRRFRRHPVEAQTVNLREFWALEACRIGALISRRNSGLGRVMTPSQRLLYELDFIRAAQDCEAEPDLAAKLGEVVATKTKALRQHGYTAVWGGVEVARLWARSAGGVPLGAPPTAPSKLLAAAQRLAHFAPDPLATLPPGEPLEAHLKALGALPEAGQLHVSLAATQAWLAPIDGLLAQAAARGCPDPAAVQRAFSTHYLKVIQPYLSRLDRRGRPLFAALHRLHEAAAVGVAVSPQMQRWMTATLDPAQGALPRWRAQVKAHTAAWRALLDTCGLAPG